MNPAVIGLIAKSCGKVFIFSFERDLVKISSVISFFTSISLFLFIMLRLFFFLALFLKRSYQVNFYQLPIIFPHERLG
jgi:hypothetical protein